MDSYIIRIYRRDNKNQPLTGTVELVGEKIDSLQRNPFNNPEKLWELLSVTNKPGKFDPQNNQIR